MVSLTMLICSLLIYLSLQWSCCDIYTDEFPRKNYAYIQGKPEATEISTDIYSIPVFMVLERSSCLWNKCSNYLCILRAGNPFIFQVTFDVFSIRNMAGWKNVMEWFNREVASIEGEAKHFIDESFTTQTAAVLARGAGRVLLGGFGERKRRQAKDHSGEYDG